ncbi:MAG: 2-C-methyl-D-erythritol 2,4-cyclodiphosphate synthase [Peptococcaceae bacterium]|nr:2-C-methyl-D-erythritol 2,4-cyclodiphosphate synthase [Peptococcaceae bacterium]
MNRIGFGYDAHRIGEGVPLILGGIELPWPKGLISHSDGDVLLHAIMDALLGAACLGDIGVHFPDTDPAYKDCSSLTLLHRVRDKVNQAGYAVNNIDCTLVAERPKIAPYSVAMREKISQTLGLRLDQVNVKATTAEHMGFTGREEGMACYAVCILIPLPDE